MGAFSVWVGKTKQAAAHWETISVDSAGPSGAGGRGLLRLRRKDDTWDTHSPQGQALNLQTGFQFEQLLFMGGGTTTNPTFRFNNFSYGTVGFDPVGQTTMSPDVGTGWQAAVGTSYASYYADDGSFLSRTVQNASEPNLTGPRRANRFTGPEASADTNLLVFQDGGWYPDPNYPLYVDAELVAVSYKNPVRQPFYAYERTFYWPIDHGVLADALDRTLLLVPGYRVGRITVVDEVTAFTWGVPPGSPRQARLYRRTDIPTGTASCYYYPDVQVPTVRGKPFEIPTGEPFMTVDAPYTTGPGSRADDVNRVSNVVELTTAAQVRARPNFVAQLVVDQAPSGEALVFAQWTYTITVYLVPG